MKFLYRRNKYYRFLVLAGALVLMCSLLFVFTGCNKKEGKTKGEELEKAISVKTEIAKAVRIAEVTRVPVTLKPMKETDLSFKIGGRVKRIQVELGDMVKKGELLVQLDDTDIQNQIKQAEMALEVAKASLANLKAGSRPEDIQISRAQLQQAEANLELQAKNFERMKKLYEQELISKQQYDSAVAAYNSAEAQVRMAKETLTLAQKGASEEALGVTEAQVRQAQVGLEIAKSQLKDLSLVAPFSGYVTFLRINEEEMASPGAPVVGLADLSKVSAVGYVGQSLINSLSLGDPVSVSVQTNGEREDINGKITVLSSTVDSQLRTYEFKITLENISNRLKGGMVGEAYFVVRESDSQKPVVPREAVVERNGERMVYIVENNRAVAKNVSTGVDNGKAIEIRVGLELGAEVVVSGQHQLNDGALVEVK